MADFLMRADDWLAGEIPDVLILWRTTLANWPDLFRCPALSRVVQLVVSIPEPSADLAATLTHCPHLAGLRGLWLDGRYPGDAVLRLLADSPYLRLRSLMMGGFTPSADAVTPDTMAAFARSPAAEHLEQLDLTRQHLGDEELTALAASARWPLRSLSLAVNHIGDEGVRSLCAAPWTARLQTLRLSGNRITSDSLSALASLPALQELGIQATPLSRQGGLALASAPFAALRRLNLLGTMLGDDGLTALARAAWLPHLRELDLPSGQISWPALSEFLRQAPLDALSRLSMSWVNLDADGVAVLADNPSARALRSLDLSGNPIGDEGLRLLCREDLFPSVEVLHLFDCQITDTGLSELANSPRLGRLTDLQIGESDERSAGLIALAASPALATLECFALHGEFGEAAWHALLASPHLSRDAELLFSYDLSDELATAFRQRQRYPSLVSVNL